MHSKDALGDILLINISPNAIDEWFNPLEKLSINSFAWETSKAFSISAFSILSLRIIFFSIVPEIRICSSVIVSTAEIASSNKCKI